jgi:hypothetical protein
VFGKPKSHRKLEFFCDRCATIRFSQQNNFKKRNWEGPIECKMYGQAESTKHIFADCVLAKYGWSLFRDVLE